MSSRIGDPSRERSRTYDLRVMSSNPITAEFYEKLLFLRGFRVCDSYAPEEQWLAESKYIKATNDSQFI